MGKFQLTDDISGDFNENYFSRILNPNMDLLTRVYQDIAGQLHHSIFFMLLAFIFLAWTVKKRGWIQILPIMSFIIFIYVYYAYVYKYGIPGGGDHGSALRYAMPVILPLYFLGALGFQAAMDGINSRSWPSWARGLLQLILAGLVISKLF